VAAPAGDAVVFRTATATVLADGSMILPLDHYDAYATANAEQTVFEAATKLETACMRAAGTSLPQGYGGNFLPSEIPTIAVYGVSDIAEAEHFGYRLPGGSAGAAPAVSTKTLSAFYGSKGSSSGCAAQAAAGLDISQANEAWDLVQSLRLQTLSGTNGDPRIATANKAWSGCMTAAGYHYADPMQPTRDKSLLGRGLSVPHGALLPPPSPAEEAAAVTDVRCKQKVGYLDTFATVWAGYQEQAIRQNANGLVDALDEWHATLRDAEAVLDPAP
jgi:hypothetical protein